MQSENRRRIIRNVAVIGGIVLILIVLFLIVRALFTTPEPAKTDLTDPLINTSSDRGVRMTVRGPIVAPENARTYEIDVTPTSRSVTLYGGYDGTVLAKQVYDNSPSSYEQFVYALDRAQMTNDRSTSATTTRGVCASGRLFTFALERDTDIASSLWTSSCNGSPGTLDANVGLLTNLFNAQIPSSDVAKYTTSF